MELIKLEEHIRGRTPKTDQEMAVEIRTHMRPALEAIAEAMNIARKFGLDVSFSMKPNAFGKYEPPQIAIVRSL